MKPICLAILLVIAVLTMSACDEGQQAAMVPKGDRFELVLYDADGAVVASGWLEVPDLFSPPADDGNVTLSGRWRLESANAAYPASFHSNTYEAHLTPRRYFINLHPMVADANVVLAGKWGEHPFAGEWCFTSVAGPELRGTFTLQSQADPPD